MLDTYRYLQVPSCVEVTLGVGLDECQATNTLGHVCIAVPQLNHDLSFNAPIFNLSKIDQLR